MEKLHQSIQDELLAMSEADQAMRNKAQTSGEWDAGLDMRNTARLKEIIASVGWPVISKVGPEASTAAWLLVQHADHDPGFQADCLRLMKALPKDDVKPANVAYLEDRVLVNTDKPQLYGTQFFGTGDTFGPRPVEDEANLDHRRAAVGLPLFADYRAQMETVYNKHNQMTNTAQDT